MINRICIIGGGNIGMALAVELGQNTDAKLIMLTSKSNMFQKEIFSVDIITNNVLSCNLSLITDNYENALNDVDLVFITVPSFSVANIVNKMKLNKKTIICFVPGTGGKEYYCEELHKQGHIILGMDRTPFVARIFEKGKSVSISKKSQIRISSVKKSADINAMAKLFCNILNMSCFPLNNYLTVTLTPSNPILHTSRLFSMFIDKKINSEFENQIKFYAEWDDKSSFYLLAADEELQAICRGYEAIYLTDVVSLKKHYESNTKYELTNKIKSIKSWNNIDSPLLYNNKKYIIDRESRFFIEDFPYGLCIIKSFAVIAGVYTPVIDKILKWFETFFNAHYFINDNFNGEDLRNLSLPQNFGLHSIKEIENYYLG